MGRLTPPPPPPTHTHTHTTPSAESVNTSHCAVRPRSRAVALTDSTLWPSARRGDAGRRAGTERSGGGGPRGQGTSGPVPSAAPPTAVRERLRASLLSRYCADPGLEHGPGPTALVCMRTRPSVEAALSHLQHNGSSSACRFVKNLDVRMRTAGMRFRNLQRACPQFAGTGHSVHCHALHHILGMCCLS